MLLHPLFGCDLWLLLSEYREVILYSANLLQQMTGRHMGTSGVERERGIHKQFVNAIELILFLSNIY